MDDCCEGCNGYPCGSEGIVGVGAVDEAASGGNGKVGGQHLDGSRRTAGEAGAVATANGSDGVKLATALGRRG